MNFLTATIGIPTHEIIHAIPLFLFTVKIEEINLLYYDKKENIYHGYVNYNDNFGYSLIKRLGLFISSIAPTINAIFLSNFLFYIADINIPTMNINTLFSHLNITWSVIVDIVVKTTEKTISLNYTKPSFWIVLIISCLILNASIPSFEDIKAFFKTSIIGFPIIILISVIFKDNLLNTAQFIFDKLYISMIILSMGILLMFWLVILINILQGLGNYHEDPNAITEQDLDRIEYYNRRHHYKTTAVGKLTEQDLDRIHDYNRRHHIDDNDNHK
jgi:hypothetical protein